MVHKAFILTEIAVRYYKIAKPEKRYSRHYAIRQWRQDNHINRDILKVVVGKVFEEQTKLLNKK